ncbi:MAG: hypothetical protein ACM30I_01875 [Gemmatimonas sp.]
MARTFWTTRPTFHVDPVNGDDSNDGIALPFKTIAGAYKALKSKHDFGDNSPIVQLADGNYYAGPDGYVLFAFGTPVGAELIKIVGNMAHPENVKIWADALMPAIYLRDHAILQIDGVTFKASGSYSKAVFNEGQGAVVDIANCRFDAMPLGTHLVGNTGGFFNVGGHNYIDGGAYAHLRISSAVQFSYNGTLTVAGGLEFRDASNNRGPFAQVADGARLYGGVTVDGAGAGSNTVATKYQVINATLISDGTVWPGDVSGTIS